MIGRYIRQGPGRAYVLLLIAIGFTFWRVDVVQKTQGRDERAACAIQARGLPAAHHLAAVMRDINVFLQPIRGEHLPPKVLAGRPNPLYYAIVNIRSELPVYLQITAKQPASRHC